MPYPQPDHPAWRMTVAAVSPPIRGHTRTRARTRRRHGCRRRRLRGTAADVEQAEAMVALMRTGRGQENPAFRQVFISLFLPGGSSEQMSWFNDLQRKTTSAENALRIRHVSDNMNVVDLLPRVEAPALCFIAVTTRCSPSMKAAALPRRSPAPTSCPLEGRNHLILDSDPG
jgi:hypothetical protein